MRNEDDKMSKFIQAISAWFRSKRPDNVSRETRRRSSPSGHYTTLLSDVFDKYSEEKTELGYSELLAAILDHEECHVTQLQIKIVLASAGYGDSSLISFGEFCIIMEHIQDIQFSENSPPITPTKLVKKCPLICRNLSKKRCKRMISGSSETQFQVFLGGSCTPTTWRHQLAVPFFQKHEIPYFNPQVLHWTPDLIEKEDEAKQTSELLFFVIDSQTRSTVSLVEAAYLAGCGRRMVLVIIPYEGGDGVHINGVPLTGRELDDYNSSRKFLSCLADFHSIPIFSHINDALNHVLDISHDIPSMDSDTKDPFDQETETTVSLQDRLLKLKEAYDKYAVNSGTINLTKLCDAYNHLNPEDHITTTDASNMLHSTHPGALFSLDDFYVTCTEFKHRKRKMSLEVPQPPSPTTHCSVNFLDWLRRRFGHSRGFSSHAFSTGKHHMFDVYIEGTYGQSKWRERMVIPMLKNNNTSFYLPKDTLRQNPLQPRKCRIVLVFIEKDATATLEMMQIAHDIGKAYNMVLCIQQVQAEELEDSSKDFNRSRMYLMDCAQREGIPVFDDLKASLECVIQTVRLEKSRSGIK